MVGLERSAELLVQEWCSRHLLSQKKSGRHDRSLQSKKHDVTIPLAYLIEVDCADSDVDPARESMLRE